MGGACFRWGAINLIYKDRQICTTDGYRSPDLIWLKSPPTLAVGVKRKIMQGWVLRTTVTKMRQQGQSKASKKEKGDGGPAKKVWPPSWSRPDLRLSLTRQRGYGPDNQLLWKMEKVWCVFGVPSFLAIRMWGWLQSHLVCRFPVNFLMLSGALVIFGAWADGEKMPHILILVWAPFSMTMQYVIAWLRFCLVVGRTMVNWYTSNLHLRHVITTNLALVCYIVQRTKEDLVSWLVSCWQLPWFMNGLTCMSCKKLM